MNVFEMESFQKKPITSLNKYVKTEGSRHGTIRGVIEEGRWNSGHGVGLIHEHHKYQCRIEDEPCVL